MKNNEFVGEDGNMYEVRAIMVYSPNCFCRHLVPSDPDFLTAAETAESWMISIPAYLPDINPWNGRVLAIAWALGECQESLSTESSDLPIEHFLSPTLFDFNCLKEAVEALSRKVWGEHPKSDLL
jgi:hypothetical protein